MAIQINRKHIGLILVGLAALGGISIRMLNASASEFDLLLNYAVEWILITGMVAIGSVLIMS